MLIAVKQILGSTIDGADGTVGSVKDLYFDGDVWEVRYFVVDTGNWLPGNKVLLIPADIDRSDWGDKRVFVRQTKRQVENAPSIDEDEPVSRQMERELAAYYGWPAYWDGGATMGDPTPVTAERSVVETDDAVEANERWDGDPHLRSFKEVRGYTIAAADGEIGSAADLIIDEEQWMVRYLVVDTGTWLPGRRVLLSVEWIDQIIWHDRSFNTGLSQDTIQSSPEFRPHAPVNREYEEQLYDYYGKRKYW